MLKIGKNEFLPSSVRMWGWAYIYSFDFAYAGLILRMWAMN